MQYIPTSKTAIESIKRSAKSIQVSEGLAYSQALEKASSQAGYESFHHVQWCHRQVNEDRFAGIENSYGWLKYHPHRFFHLRTDRDWERTTMQVAAARQKDEAMRFVGVAEAFYMKHRENPSSMLLDEEVKHFPVERLESALGFDCSDIGSLEGSIISWVPSGRIIYDLRNFGTALCSSDALKFSVKDINLPAPCVYAHWGAALGIKGPTPNTFVDGCYIEKDPDGQSFNFTMTATVPNYVRLDNISSLMAGLCAEAEGCLWLIGPSYDRTEGEYPPSLGQVEERFSDMEGGNLIGWAPMERDCLIMAMNALRLVSMQPRFVERYATDASKALVAQALANTEPSSSDAREELMDLGFEPVRVLVQETEFH